MFCIFSDFVIVSDISFKILLYIIPVNLAFALKRISLIRTTPFFLHGMVMVHFRFCIFGNKEYRLYIF